MAESLLLSDLARASQRVWLANAARKESHEWHHHPTPKLMSEEIFDVVNQEDAIVGQAPRSTVHAENLLHRAVHVLVFHEDGRLFLQKRSMTKDCFPGTWVPRHRGIWTRENPTMPVPFGKWAKSWDGFRIGLLRNFSNSQPAWKPVGNSSGFTASLTMALLYCTRKKSSPVSGLRPMR